MKKVTKAVIAAAGLGTRFLPQTKAIPKEMLPLIDKPIIQHVVEEAVAAGITDVIIVTGAHKRPIEDHFDRHSELENYLLESGKIEMASKLRGIADMANFVYVRQKGLSGTATPILNVAHLLGNEPFLYLFGDDLFFAKVPRAVQLIKEFEELHEAVIALTPLSPFDSAKAITPYGVPEIRRQIRPDLLQIARIVEKPSRADRGSDFASVSGYVLTPEIIDILRELPEPTNREFYLTDGLAVLAKRSKLYGKVIDGNWHDTGNKSKYLEAIVDIAWNDKELGPDFRRYLSEKLKS